MVWTRSACWTVRYVVPTLRHIHDLGASQRITVTVVDSNINESRPNVLYKDQPRSSRE